MTRETEEKLAASLTAEETGLVPFLPYLLQDFWELGSNPAVMADLIAKHVKLTTDTRGLDLASGKGAVSVRIARECGVRVKGIDLIPEFVAYAQQKAREFEVSELCEFAVGDINQAVEEERGYDCVVFGAVGAVLGGPAESLEKLAATVKPGGYILIDEGYLPESGAREDVKYSSYDFFREGEWMAFFQEAGLELVETVPGVDEESDSGMAAIIARAGELMELHPDKKAMFEGYVRSQQNEYDDLANSLVCVTWMLRKR